MYVACTVQVCIINNHVKPSHALYQLHVMVNFLSKIYCQKKNCFLYGFDSPLNLQ